MADQFQKEQGIDVRKDTMALQRLQEACEKAKRELSSTPQTDINLPFITADASGPKHLLLTLSRSKFEELIDPFLDRIRKPVEQALADANLQSPRHRRSRVGGRIDARAESPPTRPRLLRKRAAPRR